MKMKNWNAQSNKINIKKLPKFSAFFSDLEICCALIFKKKVIASIIIDKQCITFYRSKLLPFPIQQKVTNAKKTLKFITNTKKIKSLIEITFVIGPVS